MLRRRAQVAGDRARPRPDRRRRRPPSSSARATAGRPARATIDSREVAPGDLFFGLPGTRTDGGAHAAAALAAGAWGVVVEPARARRLAETTRRRARSSPPPTRCASLQLLATAWRRELDCQVVGITGSTGKTSVKDIARALLPGAVHASRENFNTEIGLPLTILAAPAGTDVLVLEMAMRGIGQIAELCEIAEPDVGAITNVGPVHLELLGTLEAIAEAKAEILAGLGPDGTAVVPAEAEALAPHLDERLRTVTFGDGGDVVAVEARRGRGLDRGDGSRRRTARRRSSSAFAEQHNLTNALCAIAIGVALGAGVEGMARRTARHILLPPAGGDDRAPRGRPARERLLQRQPPLDAGRARQPRVDRGAGPPDRRPRRHGGARLGRGPTITARSASASAGTASTS